MKGDRVEVVVDTGNGAQSFEISARRAGRRVDISVSRGVVEVSEVTRGGTAIRTGRFMANRIIALVEHPAADLLLESDGPSAIEARARPRGAGGGGDADGGRRAAGERLPDELWSAETPALDPGELTGA